MSKLVPRIEHIICEVVDEAMVLRSGRMHEMVEI